MEIISSGTISVPSYAAIKACAIEFSPDVIHARCGLYNTSIEGFSHENVHKYGLLHSTYDMKFPFWRNINGND